MTPFVVPGTDFPRHQGVRRVFQEGFCVNDIARPLLSFEGAASASQVKALLEQQGGDVAGIRTGGFVTGFVSLESLLEGDCQSVASAFDSSLVVSATLPLGELVLRLESQPRLFVEFLGQVAGVVCRHDLLQPPARMWLFGMITLLEMRFNRMIEQYCPGDSWVPLLSPGRVRKTEQLLTLRRRHNDRITLSDCLQLSDKITIIARHETLRQLTRFESRRQIEIVGKKIELLRNSLAHSQDIISDHWETIVALVQNLDSVIDGPPKVDGL